MINERRVNDFTLKKEFFANFGRIKALFGGIFPFQTRRREIFPPREENIFAISS